jgi:hypothetical protein
VLDLVEGFSASTEMIKSFLSLLLLICCIIFLDLHMLNTPTSWIEGDLVMVDDFSDVLLNLVCHYFVEDFCIDVH